MPRYYEIEKQKREELYKRVSEELEVLLSEQPELFEQEDDTDIRYYVGMGLRHTGHFNDEELAFELIDEILESWP